VSTKKILVVEDDADMRMGLKVRLQASGYAPVLAADAIAAISQAQKERPDLILLDLGLPGGDGFKVLERLRSIPRLAVIPVIVVTARDPKSNEEKTAALGATAFLQKPVDNEALLAAIRAALGT
jgi:DNA-binding response OmpR family regulator